MCMHLLCGSSTDTHTHTVLCPRQVDAKRLTFLSLQSTPTHCSNSDLDRFYSRGVIGPAGVITV